MSPANPSLSDAHGSVRQVFELLGLVFSALMALLLILWGLFYIYIRIVGPPQAYFPGDPPTVDLFFMLALVGWPLIAFTLGAAFVLDRRGAPARTFFRRGRRIAGVLVGLSFLALSPVTVRIAGRHFGEWGELKALLRESEASVLAHVQPRGETLTPEEVERARHWMLSNSVYFQFKELPRPVQIRVMSNGPPYVGVDFGNGQRALFDPMTMICKYSD